MTIELAAGDLTLALRPEYGGCVAAFQVRRAEGAFDLMRPLLDNTDAVRSAMFPMVPFANCIRDNRFSSDGVDYAVSANMPGARLNFHGSGWQSRWDARSALPDRAVLALDEGAVDTVFRYAATQAFELDEDGLTVTLSLTNTGRKRMPFSFGLHPWFPTHGGASVSFASSELLRTDAEGQLVARRAIPPGDDYGVPRHPPVDYLNVCYGGWDGSATIDWGDARIRLRLRADPIFGYLMVHVPNTGEAVVCLEPQSCAPCGFDDPDAPVSGASAHLLEPQQRISGRVRFDIEQRQ